MAPAVPHRDRTARGLGAGGRLGVVVRSFPRLSQTFVLAELLSLEEFGFDIDLFALAPSDEAIVQPEAARLRAAVHYLEPRPCDDPMQALRHLAVEAAGPQGYTASSPEVLLGQAGHLAALVRERGITRLHAHFAHDPTLVTLLASLMTGVPFGFTAHARDLLQVPSPALAERMRLAVHVITCCAANVEYLNEVAPDVPVHLIPHGVDVERFRPGDVYEPGLVVSAGRLVAKKGFATLVGACERLPARTRCEIYGDGPLQGQLRRLAGERVVFKGACTQQEIAVALSRAAVFALTPEVTADGDRDGIPNVLMEAMAVGLPVVSTAVGGVGEVVEHNVNGLLVEPGDIEGVARCLETVLSDGTLRDRLGLAARATMVAGYSSRVWARRLASLHALSPVTGSSG